MFLDFIYNADHPSIYPSIHDMKHLQSLLVLSLSRLVTPWKPIVLASAKFGRIPHRSESSSNCWNKKPHASKLLLAIYHQNLCNYIIWIIWIQIRIPSNSVFTKICSLALIWLFSLAWWLGNSLLFFVETRIQVSPFVRIFTKNWVKKLQPTPWEIWESSIGLVFL